MILNDMDFKRTLSETFRTEEIEEFSKNIIEYTYQNSNGTANNIFNPIPARI